MSDTIWNKDSEKERDRKSKKIAATKALNCSGLIEIQDVKVLRIILLCVLGGDHSCKVGIPIRSRKNIMEEVP